MFIWKRALTAGAAVIAVAGSTLAMAPLGAAPASCPAEGTAVARPAPLPNGTGEVSGLVASAHYPGWWWMLRDSGNPASLFAARWPDGDGPPEVREVRLTGATNTDWEDLVYRWGPTGGRLTIIESGQGGGNQRLYDLPEPDPLGPGETTDFVRYDYAYPGPAAINTEAGFWFMGRLVLVTKTGPGQVYRFERPLSTGGVNVPVLVGPLAGADFISVARVSPDYRTIVAADHERVIHYEAPGMTKDLRALIGSPPARCRHLFPGDNVEAGDFLAGGQPGFMLVAESRNVYRLRADG